MGRTFQNTHLFRELTVRENVETAARVAQQYRPSVYRPTEELLDQFGLQDVSRQRAGTLPYGAQRQVEMARAVALGPDLLLLDEPAAGANEMESARMMETIRRIRDVEKCTILLIDHDLPFVLNLCERLYVLDAGRVIAEGDAAGDPGRPEGQRSLPRVAHGLREEVAAVARRQRSSVRMRSGTATSGKARSTLRSMVTSFTPSCLASATYSQS